MDTSIIVIAILILLVIVGVTSWIFDLLKHSRNFTGRQRAIVIGLEIIIVIVGMLLEIYSY